MVKKYLESEGYNVIVVPETATNLIPNGYSFNYIGSINQFQNMILDYQSFNENKTNDMVSCNYSKSSNTIILYDRGILDNKAYFNNINDFDYMMKKNNISEIDILDSYDLVLDLLSTAVCDEKKYTTSNNVARRESVEEAKLLDSKTANAWLGHENMYFI